MIWATGSEALRAQRRFHAQVKREVPAVRRLVRVLFRQEHAALRRAQPHVVHPDEFLLYLEAAQDHDAWMRLYRRIHVTIGANHARSGIPPEERSIGVAWGTPDDPWWHDVFRFRLGDEDWWDPWLVATLRYAQEHSGAKIRGIHRATRLRVQAAIEATLQEGGGIADAMHRIDELYLTRIIPHRSEVIARTEVLNSARAGSHEATIASGYAPEVLKSWLATPDDRTRSSHVVAQFTEQDVPFTDPFHLDDGSLLMYPGDASLGAPGHQLIQCRCTVTQRLK